MLEALLGTTDRVVQEIDSVEYGLTDIQEYYANTGADRFSRQACTCKYRRCLLYTAKHAPPIPPSGLTHVLTLCHKHPSLTLEACMLSACAVFQTGLSCVQV